MERHILIVDDDYLLCRSLSFSLQQAGFQTTIVGSAEEGLNAVAMRPPHAVLLDISLPGMDGLEALHSFKDHCGAPILFVTAHRRQLDEIIGLEAGADDYITKPFDFDVLLAHLKAVLRRGTSALPNAELLQVGDLSIDRTAHTVLLRDQLIDLSPREFELLYVMAEQSNHVLSIETLLSRVWGPDWIGETQTIYVHVRWLREKLEDDPAHPQRLVTVKGVGYKLVGHV